MSVLRIRITVSAAITLGALLAGCGGGPGGSPPPSTIVTTAPSTTAPVTTATPVTISTAAATPSAAPSGAATAAPTPIPSAPVGVADFHPDDNGSSYTFSGSSTTTYTRPNQYPSPEPTQTTAVSIAQAVTVSNPATFAGNTTAYDFHTVETDAQTAPVSQTTSTTYDNYYAYTNTLYTGNFQYLGFTSTDYEGNTVSTTYAPGGVLADMLPEASGQSWTNPPTATVTTTDPSGGETSTQQIAADGTYTTTITYQNVNAQGSNRTTATVTSNLDGSGQYLTPRLGTDQGSNYSYVVTAPSGGTITETTTIPPTVGTTSTPDAVTTSFASWIPTGFVGAALANETDTDSGSTTIPASCAVPASLGSTANLVTQVKNRIDPMLGQQETTTTSNYVIPNVGPACVVVDDVLTYYYDFTGQSGVGYFSPTAQQVSELQETLGLTQEQLTANSRTGGTRFASSRRVAARTELALAHIATARGLERARFLRSIARHERFVAVSSRTGGSF